MYNNDQDPTGSCVRIQHAKQGLLSAQHGLSKTGMRVPRAWKRMNDEARKTTMGLSANTQIAAHDQVNPAGTRAWGARLQATVKLTCDDGEEVLCEHDGREVDDVPHPTACMCALAEQQ
jgi:hypothetical protein